MKDIIPDISSGLSKMRNRIFNLENSLFPNLKEQFGTLSTKEGKLIKILDFAQIENNITVLKITNPPRDREEMTRAFIAKSVYNMQLSISAERVPFVDKSNVMIKFGIFLILILLI